MSLGQKILELRKRRGFSQEQFGEKINVTRQTISNWELGETSPNPEQLKLISKEFNVSIDELLDNDIKDILIDKVNNTENTTKLLSKILKWLGILLLIILIIDIVSFIIFGFFKYNNENVFNEVQGVEFKCSIDGNNYNLTILNDGYFSCLNCSKDMENDLRKNYIDFNDISKTTNNIINYFEINNGTCEE